MRFELTTLNKLARGAGGGGRTSLDLDRHGAAARLFLHTSVRSSNTCLDALLLFFLLPFLSIENNPLVSLEFEKRNKHNKPKATIV